MWKVHLDHCKFTSCETSLHKCPKESGREGEEVGKERKNRGGGTAEAGRANQSTTDQPTEEDVAKRGIEDTKRGGRMEGVQLAGS